MVTCSPQQAALDATWEYSWTRRGQIQLHQVRAISKQWEKWRQQILSNAGNGWCNITRRCSGEDNYYNAGLVLNSLSGFDRVKFEYIIQLAEHSAGQGAQCNCYLYSFQGCLWHRQSLIRLFPAEDRRYPPGRKRGASNPQPTLSWSHSIMVVLQKVQSKAKHAAHLPSKDNKEKESTWLERLEKTFYRCK